MSHSEPQSVWSRYIFSTDHKVIAIQYISIGLIMAVIGGYMSYVIRMKLAWPADSVVGFGDLAAQQYNMMVTMHGTIMVFWVAMPILVAGFGNYLIPLMVGTDDMAFPTLNMLSIWTFILSTVVLMLSLFVPGGAAAGGWTSYPPLAADPRFSGVDLGITLWILAVALEFVAFLMGGVNFITTAINRRAPGMSMWDLPLFVWEEVMASIIFMLSVGPLVAGAVMLLIDHNFGTGFFDPAQGGDPLLFQHLFWFFGHPEVYVLLLPALGILAEVMTACSRKALFGYKMVVWSTIISGLLSFVVWAHHQFISGIDPRLAFPFSLTTILISVPFAVTIFAFIATLWGGSIRMTPAMGATVLMLATFLLGGCTGIILGSAAVDIYMHDTMFVVAHFHYTMVPIVIFAPIAGFYHYFPKMFGKPLDGPLAWLHIIGTGIFFNLCFLPIFTLGFMGHQRRISDPTQFGYIDGGESLQVLATVGAIGALVSQIPFAINLLKSLLSKRKAESNPWKATTLDWQTPSPPPHGNFASTPTVYRGPYFYSPPGIEADYIPQDQQPDTAPPDHSQAPASETTTTPA